MPHNSIEDLISAEKSKCHISGHVVGTPRTYGATKNDNLWRQCIRDGEWSGLSTHSLPLNDPVFLTFSFRVAPWGKGNGSDIDTLVIGAFGGLTPSASRPTLGLLCRASYCWGYAATKALVGTKGEAGVDITVSIRPPVSLVEFYSGLPKSKLDIRVRTGRDRRAMAKEAAEQQNRNGCYFSASTKSAIVVAFANGRKERNIASASNIEALIDGLGAACVGDRYLFDNPKGIYKKQIYNYDDSCFFSILAGRFDFSADAEADAFVSFYDHNP